MSYCFADTDKWWEEEMERMAGLTMDHTVPILRFSLQWSKTGEVESFAGGLLRTKQQQFLFELANKGA